MLSWQVFLFGQFECRFEDSQRALPAGSKVQSLLANLCFHRDRTFPRSILAVLIAPDFSETQARHALSQALWRVRRNLPGLLESDSGQVGVASQVEVWVDAIEFQGLAERYLRDPSQPAAELAGLRQAVNLYRGDFLEGFYDEWALIERERLRDLYLRVLERLVVAYKAAMQYQQALITAQRLVHADPLNENAHREVMRLFHYLGCPAEALRQYEICQEILQREFGLTPEAETSQIAHAISQRSGIDAFPYLPEPQGVQVGSLPGVRRDAPLPLVGRSAERACLVDWLRQNQPAGGRLVLLEGEAGVGKTRLLQEVARDMEWYGSQVVWGKTMPHTRSRPLEPLVSALEAGLTLLRVEQLQHLVEPVWLQTLQHLLPGLTQNLARLVPLADLEGQQAKIRLFEGLFQLLAAWVQINPLVIILEDVHLAAGDSIEVLAELAPRLVNKNVFLVLSYRSEELAGLPEIWAKLDAIQPEAIRGRLALAGLDTPAVQELIQASLGAGVTSPAFQEVLSRETHGNPLFLLELLRGLYDEGVLRRNNVGAWITPYDSVMGEVDLPLPPAVEQVIVRRLEQLPADLRSLLEGLSVLGGEFDFERITCLGLADAPVLVTWLQALCRRKLLVESTQAYHFSHDKIRQVVYESLGEAQRTVLHARLAAALEKINPDQVETLAYHATRAQSAGKAAVYHWRSAENARRANAYTTALVYLNHALAMATQAGLPVEEQFQMLKMHLEVVEVLGDMQLWQNDLDAMACLAGSDAPRWAITRQKQIEYLVQTCRYVEAEAAARHALSLAEDQGDRPSQAAALASLGSILDLVGRRQSATECLQNAVHLYQQLADRRGEVGARGSLANVLAKSEQRAAARVEFETILVLYEAIGHQPGCADTLAVLGVLSDFDGNFEAAIDYSSRALEICHSIGYRLGEAYASHELGSALLKLGQIGKSLDVLQKTLEISLAIGERRIEALTRLFLSDIYSNIGDYPAAIHEAEAGMATARLIADPVIQGMCLNYMGEAFLKVGKGEESRIYLQQALDVLQANDCGLRLPEVYLSLVQLELTCSQPQEAKEKLEIAESLCRQYGLEVYTESLLCLRAEVLLAFDRPEEALDFINQGIPRLNDAKGNHYWTYFLQFRILTRLERFPEARLALEHAHQGLTMMLAGLSVEQREMSCRNIASHRQILDAWQSTQPRRITARLPRADAPLGRPLRVDEWVEIPWTVATLDDDAIPGKVDRRRARLLRLLQEALECGAAPASEHLAQALGVSLRTIAGDLATLEAEHGSLLRTVLRGRSRRIDSGGDDRG
jgi:DNA-binding SARP family transcriptional activator